MRKFIQDMLSSSSAISSKRVAGFLGWLVCLAIVIYNACNGVTDVAGLDWLFACSSALLGLDSITDIFKKKSN